MLAPLFASTLANFPPPLPSPLPADSSVLFAHVLLVCPAAASVEAALGWLSLHPSPTIPSRPPALMDGVYLHGIDTLLLLRVALRCHILRLVHTHRCALVTAPPGAGKSSVIQLLEQELLGANKRVLIAGCVGLGLGLHPEVWLIQLARNVLRQMPGAVPDVQTLAAVLDAFDYIFIDDAQRTFLYPNFWQALIKSKGRAHIVLFASYSIETADEATPSVPAKVRAPLSMLQYEPLVVECSLTHSSFSSCLLFAACV